LHAHFNSNQSKIQNSKSKMLASGALAMTKSLSTRTTSITRIPRQPSERDLAIWKRVNIKRHPQYEVAVDFQLKYSRISQIVKRVGQWLAAGGDPIDPQIKDHIGRQHLAHSSHKLRLARAIELATAAMEAEPTPVTTTRKRTIHGSEIWREETTRDAPYINLNAVRLLVRATEALNKLNNQDETEPEPCPATEQNLFPAVHSLLCRWRAEAVASGRVPPVPDIPTLTTTLLNTFLGACPEPKPVTSVVAGLPTEPQPIVVPDPVLAGLPTANVVAGLPTEPPPAADSASPASSLRSQASSPPLKNR
jgi:hypothetical protein